MMLSNHDTVCFDITPTGMTLQLLELEKGEPDTVVLHGRDVALLLYRLTTANADGPVIYGEPSKGKLEVRTAYSGPGPNQMTVWFESGHNTVSMRPYERDMLVDAIKSRVWRLFT